MTFLEIIVLICMSVGNNQSVEVGCLEFYDRCTTHQYDIEIIDNMESKLKQRYCLQQTVENYISKK